MARVVTFGEAMLRLSPPGRGRLEQARSLDVWPAGSELNVAVGLARLGDAATWVSRLPQNQLGRLIEAHARANGVETAHVSWSEDGRLGLYFVEVAAPPRSTTALYDREHSTFATLDPAELDWPAILGTADGFHVSGITPALSQSCARATEDALRAARASGCHTSYDVNFRRRLTSPETAAARLEAVVGLLDVLFCSPQDARELFDLDEPEALRERLGVRMLVFCGRERRIAVGETTETHERPIYEPLDPIGAGDAFCAGFLHERLNGGDLRAALEFGEAMSALKLTIPGDAPLVHPDEVSALRAGATLPVQR
jgi:2-dehydro-3-deoxygluconokinase